MMDRCQRDGVEEINKAEWVEREGFWYLNVFDQNGLPVECYLERRPPYCDRGHFYLKIDGRLNLDDQDGFPRYFFRFEEACRHARDFLKWRIWKVRGDF